MKTTKVVFTVFLFFVFTITSTAQTVNENLKLKDSKSSILSKDKPSLGSLTDIKAKKQKNFSFSANLYIWTVSLSGDAALPINDPNVSLTQTPILDISMEFSEAVKQIKFAAALAGKVMIKNIGFYYDINYVKLGYDGPSPVGTGDHSVSLRAKQFIGELALVLKFPVKNKKITASGFAGTRVSAFDNTLDVFLNNSTYYEVNKSKTWADLIIGTDVKIDLSKRIFLYTKGDVGGFGISSKFTGSIFSTLGYKFSENWNTTMGFKYLYTDYDKDNFLWKMSQYGLLLAIGCTF